jgi:hypothetical protein
LRRFQPWTRQDSRLAIEKKPKTPFPKTRPTLKSFKKRKRTLSATITTPLTENLGFEDVARCPHMKTA